MADNLGITCYDREIIKKVAQESGLCEQFIEEKGEYGNRVAIEAFFATGNYYNGISLEDSIWAMQQQLITDIAEKEPCVIVGRCADYILKNRTDVLKVFIHSDKKSRIARMESEYGERPVDPEKTIKEKDKRRASYVQFYTDTKWGDSKNYQVTLDSGALGIDKCVEIISAIYKA